MDQKHCHNDDVIVDREFPVVAYPGRPPDDGGEDDAHEYARRVGLEEHVHRSGASSESAEGDKGGRKKQD